MRIDCSNKTDADKSSDSSDKDAKAKKDNLADANETKSYAIVAVPSATPSAANGHSEASANANPPPGSGIAVMRTPDSRIGERSRNGSRERLSRSGAEGFAPALRKTKYATAAPKASEK